MKKLSAIIITPSFALLFIATVLSSCLKSPETDGENNSKSPIGSFDFATTTDVQLAINYGLNNYCVSFEVYSQDPMEIKNNMEIKKEGVEPMFRAITDLNGKFNGLMHIPSSVHQVFIYTKYIGLPTSILMPIVKNSIEFDLTKSVVDAKSCNMLSTRTSVRGDIRILGAWNELGTPNYMLSRIKLTGELMNSIMYSLPESKHGIGATGDRDKFIRENEAIGDIRIVKNTKINLIFMHEGASMMSTLGYYCYPTDNKPTTKEELIRIAAFPNFSYAYSGGELSSGDRVQLKYWDGKQYVDEFPAGTTIGWFLIASGFNKRTSEVNGLSSLTYYSNPLLNPETNSRQHCVALRDKDKKIIAIGFEDQNRELMVNGVHLSDSDFNDAVFYIETEVIGGVDSDGIPEMIPDPTPAPDPADNYINYSGSLMFEDLWPSHGDYDMNDVVIDYQSTHYRDKDNLITKVVDRFTPRWSGASLNSGFGYQLGINSARIAKLFIESEYNSDFKVFKTDGKGLELNQSKATVVLFENINDVIRQNTGNAANLKTFTVNIEFTSPVKLHELTAPPYNPFIVAGCISKDHSSGNREREVHLPNKLPTNNANKNLLGTANDKSDPKRGRYYISDKNYMFALNIPTKFIFPDENQRLDQAYSRYSSWVTSNGTKDMDWYTDKKNPK